MKLLGVKLDLKMILFSCSGEGNISWDQEKEKEEEKGRKDYNFFF